MRPEIFHGKKKPFWRTAVWARTLAVLALGLGMANIFLNLAQALGVAMVAAFLFFFIVGMATMPSVFHPFELHVDDEGLEIRARGNTTRILWTQTDHAAVKVCDLDMFIQGGSRSDHAAVRRASGSLWSDVTDPR